MRRADRLFAIIQFLRGKRRPVTGRDRHKLLLAYQDNSGKLTRRTIWPFMLAYMEDVRVLVGHCELRDDFRHFRTDRIREARVLDERYPVPPRELRRRWDRESPHRS